MKPRKQWHKTITDDALLAYAEEAMTGMTDIGLCIDCGAEVMHVEPDARGYECELCGERAVYGIEELLMEATVW